MMLEIAPLPLAPATVPECLSLLVEWLAAPEAAEQLGRWGRSRGVDPDSWTPEVRAAALAEARTLLGALVAVHDDLVMLRAALGPPGRIRGPFGATGWRRLHTAAATFTPYVEAVFDPRREKSTLTVADRNEAERRILQILSALLIRGPA